MGGVLFNDPVWTPPPLGKCSPPPPRRPPPPLQTLQKIKKNKGDSPFFSGQKNPNFFLAPGTQTWPKSTTGLRPPARGSPPSPNRTNSPRPRHGSPPLKIFPLFAPPKPPRRKFPIPRLGPPSPFPPQSFFFFPPPAPPGGQNGPWVSNPPPAAQRAMAIQPLPPPPPPPATPQASRGPKKGAPRFPPPPP